MTNLTIKCPRVLNVNNVVTHQICAEQVTAFLFLWRLSLNVYV